MTSVQDLFDQANEWSELASQFFSESDSLKTEADELWERHEEKQEEIENLKGESDNLSREIGDFFERSQEAYHDDDHETAKELSLEAHQKIEERRGIRDNLFVLMRECERLRDKIESLRRLSKQKRDEAFRYVEETRLLRQQAKSMSGQWVQENVHSGDDKRLGDTHIDIHHQNIVGKRDRPHKDDVKISYDRRKPRVRDIWPPRKKK